MFSKNSLSDSKLLLVVNLVFTESKNLERIDTDDEGSDEDEDGLDYHAQDDEYGAATMSTSFAATSAATSTGTYA